MKRLRHYRLPIGLIGSYLLLLNLLIAAVSSGQGVPTTADLLDAALAHGICTSGGDSTDGQTPPAPVDHGPQCPLCGTSCPMGGCAPVGPFIARIVPIEPAQFAELVVFHPVLAIRSGFARYPSDAVSQAPPRAA